MKRICLIHGVGVHTSLASVCAFGDRLKLALPIEYTAVHWQHTGTTPADPRSTACLFGTVRDFTWEVLMDFTYVVREFDARRSKLPDADLYIGHSAGGILAMARPNVPCITMGCPLSLLTQINPTLMASRTPFGRDMLNILHMRDPIGSPTRDNNNVYYTNGRWNLFEYLNPIAAHVQYWKSTRASDIVIDWCKRMELV